MHELTEKILTLYHTRTSLTIIGLSAILNCDDILLIDHVRFLKTEGYIQRIALADADINPESIALDDYYKITLKGETYLSERRKIHRNNFWKEFRAWTTLVIAIASLIVSIVALSR